jgi:opacity protein-like surface antigen
MKKFIFAFILIILSSTVSYSQLKIVLGPTIGYTLPTGDYSGSTSDFYNGTKYGLGSNINFGAMGKLSLGPINFNLTAIYTPMSNTGVADLTKPNSTVEISQHLFTIGIGSQFSFGVPLSPVKPYIGFDILFSTISGSYKFQGDPSDVPSSIIDMSTATRTGLGIAAGLEFKLMSTSLDLSLRYNMINLFSKSYEGSLTSSNREESYRFLNDAKDPNYTSGDKKHPIGSNRSITTVQLQLGILFGF